MTFQTTNRFKKEEQILADMAVNALSRSKSVGYLGFRITYWICDP